MVAADGESLSLNEGVCPKVEGFQVMTKSDQIKRDIGKSSVCVCVSVCESMHVSTCMYVRERD